MWIILFNSEKFHVESLICFLFYSKRNQGMELYLSSAEDVKCFFFNHYIPGEFQPHHLES